MIWWSVLKNTDILSGMCLRAYFDKNAYLTVTIVIHFCLDFSPCCFLLYVVMGPRLMHHHLGICEAVS